MRKALVAAAPRAPRVTAAPSPALRVGLCRAPVHHGAGDRPAAGRAEAVLRALPRRDRDAVVDPDLWRNVGWEEDPNHFVDFGVPELGPYPFAALPREYGAALEKFGMATLKRNGHAAVARGRDVRQPAPRLRGLQPRARRTRRATWCCSRPSRRTTFRTRISRFTPPNNYDGQLTGNTASMRASSATCSNGSQSRLTDHARRRRRRSPTRATPRSTCCSPAISWSIGCSRPTRTRSPARTATTTSTSRSSSRGAPDPRAAAGGVDHRDRRLIIGAWEQAGNRRSASRCRARCRRSATEASDGRGGAPAAMGNELSRFD